MGKAKYFYSKRHRDFVLKWDAGCKQAAVIFHNLFFGAQCRPDYEPRRSCHFKFDPSVLEQLEAAGYDTKTLRVTIEKKSTPASSSSTDQHSDR